MVKDNTRSLECWIRKPDYPRLPYSLKLHLSEEQFNYIENNDLKIVIDISNNRLYMCKYEDRTESISVSEVLQNKDFVLCITTLINKWKELNNG